MKNKINGISLYRLRNEEHFGFHSEFVKLVNEVSLTEAFSALVDGYNGHYEDLDVAVEIIRKSIQTGQMVTADKQRLAVFRRLFQAVEGFMHCSDAAKRLAAERLDNVTRHYCKKVRGGARDARTYALHNMLQELRDAGAADLQSLGLASWVSELEAANLEYKKLKDLRYDKRAQLPAQRIDECRLVVDADYGAVVEYVNAYVVMHPEDESGAALVAAVNQRVESYNQLIALRYGIMAKARVAAEALSSSSSSSEAS